MKARTLVLSLSLLALTFLAGCVEKRLTINTEPPGALVVLNDEEIGVSPVTVPFEWYGDYSVRITKDGYETLTTHRELKTPAADWPPFDFVEDVLWPGQVVREYNWSFDLQPYSAPNREVLLKKAEAMRAEAIYDLYDVTVLREEQDQHSQ